MAFMCGAGSLPREDDPWRPSTPTGSSSRRRHGGSNPYSGRGLDKFSLLLADLETRKEKIVESAGSRGGGVALVRFTYSSSGGWVPIVVRLKEPPGPAPPAAEGNRKKSGAADARRKSPRAAEAVGPRSPAAPPQRLVSELAGAAARHRPSWRAAVVREGSSLLHVQLRRPSHYLLAAAVLVLLCLAVSGRAFAVCCTTMWWYFLPLAAPRGVEGPDARRRSMKTADYKRRAASDSGLGAAAGGGEDGAAPPRPQGRRTGGLEGLASPRRHTSRGS